MSGGSDEADGAPFDVGKKNVLLGFVEAMDFVDKKGGGGAVEGESGASRVGGFANLGDVAFHSTEIDELGVCMMGDDFGEGGFADTGRSVEDEGRKAIGFDSPAEELVVAEDVLLPDEVFEPGGTHAGCQGESSGAF